MGNHPNGGKRYEVRNERDENRHEGRGFLLKGSVKWNAVPYSNADFLYIGVNKATNENYNQSVFLRIRAVFCFLQYMLKSLLHL
jgi:hypothetical protein